MMGRYRRNTVRWFRRSLSVGLLLAATLVSGSAPNAAPASYHKLGVYSLGTYGWGSFWENGYSHYGPWKDEVEPDFDNADPYDTFWEEMTGCSATECAHSLSRRWKDQQVRHENIVGQGPFVQDNWNDFDLVFFYGHNNFIVPPHPHMQFKYHLYDSNQQRWNRYTGDLAGIGWGHTTPYHYHHFHVSWADQYPGAVVYLYNPYTSLLLGNSDFRDGPTCVYRVYWDGPSQTYAEPGLGRHLKWLILHGCQAVLVANESGSSGDIRGIQAFSQTYGEWHIVLGHYREFAVGNLPDLTYFAYSIKEGAPIKQVYFDMDVVSNSAAISIEAESSRSCFWLWGFWVCVVDVPSTRMAQDTWNDPKDLNGPGTWWWSQWIQDIT